MSSPSEWTLTIPWEPWAKHRPRVSKAIPGKARRTHQPPKDKTAEDRTHEFLQDNWPHATLLGNVRLSVRFYRATRKVVDYDNLLKHLLDAATGVIFVNDCQVTGYGESGLYLDRTNPRTELGVGVHETTMVRYYGPK